MLQGHVNELGLSPTAKPPGHEAPDLAVASEAAATLAHAREESRRTHDRTVIMNNHANDIRNLPRLKWNPRTAACNRNFAIMPVSVLRKAAWVHEDFHVPGIFWHINSTQLHMHQDPEQAMF